MAKQYFLKLFTCVVIFCLSGLSLSTLAATVELRDGAQLEGSVRLQQGTLTLDGQRTIPKSEVGRIWFGQVRSQDVPGPVSTDQKENLQELFDKAAAFARQYPDVSHLVLLDDGRYEFKADGTYVYRYRYQAQILKQEGKEIAQLVFGFKEGRDRVDLRRAQSMLPDGTVFELDRSKIMVTTPKIGTDTYLDYKIISYTIPGVEIGCIIDYEFEYEVYNPFNKDFFFPGFYFQDYVPMLVSRLTIVLPKDQEFFYELRNFPPAFKMPEPHIEAGQKVYEITLGPMPPIPNELYKPSLGDIAPYFAGSLFEGWDPVYEWLDRFYRKNTQPSEALRAFTQKLVDGIEDEDEKIARIYHYLQETIRYIIIKADAASIWGSYPADITFNNKFGCCIDKAIVFSAMLSAIGVDSMPVLVNAASHKLSQRIPTLSITHAISEVMGDEETFFLDATGANFRYPYYAGMNHGRWVVNPRERRFDFIPVPAPEKNQKRYTIDMELHDDLSLEVSWKGQYTGQHEAMLRYTWKNIKENERGRILARICNDIAPKAQLIDFNFHNRDTLALPFYYTKHYRIAEYPTQAGNFVLFGMPEFSLEFPEASGKERLYSIQYYTSENIVHDYTLKLPEKYVVRSLPKPISLSTTYASYTAGYETIDGQRIRFRSNYRRHKHFVPAKDYPEYARFLREVMRYTKKKIFIAKGTGTLFQRC